MKMRGLKNALFTTAEHFPINFNIPSQTVDGSPAITNFTSHVYIIGKFKPKMLIKNNILNPEIMIANIGKTHLTIGSCKNMTIKFNMKNINPPVKRIVRSNKLMRISAKFYSAIFFKLRGKNGLPPGRDFMFIAKKIDQLGNNGDVFSHIVDAHTAMVQIINANTENVYLFKNNKLNTIYKYEKKCYLTKAENVFLTINFGNHKPAKKHWFQRIIKAGMVMLAVYKAVVNTVTEFVISSGITIYGETPIIQIHLVETTKIYLRLWENDGSTFRVPPEKWMFINTLPDVKMKTIKVYLLKPVDPKIVDDIFDKLHAQKRMEFTTQSTFHGYPFFVVWRTIRKKRKRRVVINIRGFNKITVTDFYLMPLQSDIIFAITGYQYISMFDAAGFFHQWLVRVIDRHKFTVVSYRGQK